MEACGIGRVTLCIQHCQLQSPVDSMGKDSQMDFKWHIVPEPRAQALAGVKDAHSNNGFRHFRLPGIVAQQQ